MIAQHGPSAISKNILEGTQKFFSLTTALGANVLGLTALTQSFHAVLCSDLGDINVDELTGAGKIHRVQADPDPYERRKDLPEQVRRKIIALMTSITRRRK